MIDNRVVRSRDLSDWCARVRSNYTLAGAGQTVAGDGMGIGWFRSRRGAARDVQGETQASAAGTAGANVAEASQPHSIVSHVPGVKVDVQIKLPSGSKSRVTHFSRIGSASLGRVRLGARSLELHQEPDAQGVQWVVGDLPADATHAAFSGRAAEGTETDWQIPLDGGSATVRVALTREDVPA